MDRGQCKSDLKDSSFEGAEIRSSCVESGFGAEAVEVHVDETPSTTGVDIKGVEVAQGVRTLTCVVELAKQWDEPDLKKASDRIRHEPVTEALREKKGS